MSLGLRHVKTSRDVTIDSGIRITHNILPNESRIYWENSLQKINVDMCVLYFSFVVMVAYLI